MLENRTMKIASGIIIGTLVLSGALYFMFADKQATITLNGAGSSFVYPIMSQWASDYHDTHGDVFINYASIGSGGGIQQLREKVIDFAASDAPLKHDEFTAFNNPLHIPVVVGGIVLAYNVPDLPDGLNLTGTIVAQIFLGEITKWNDPAISQLNPQLSLPNQVISVIHRSDGSGTTFVFTDYLSHVSNDWKVQIGKGKSVDWKIGVGAKGNEGVTAQIQQTKYSIGYIELSYAEINKLKTASLQNQAGEFIKATTNSIQTAMSNYALTLPKGEESWENVTLVNAPGNGSYPIASFVYVIVYRDLNNLHSLADAKELFNFLNYIIHNGQNSATSLYYVPLSSAVVKINEQTLGLLTYNGLSLNT